MIEVMVQGVDPTEFVDQMKDRVILFPEENRKLKYFNLNNNETDETTYPRLKDIHNTEDNNTVHPRQRRSNKRVGTPRRRSGLKRRNYRNYRNSIRRNNYQNKQYTSQQTLYGSSTTWLRSGWTSWGRWSPCSQTCGSGGVQTRRRFCANASYGTQTCQGAGVETQKCFITACISYEWSEWAEWADCSKSCGGGVRYKSRSCFAQTAQKKQVSNDKCGRDLFWAYDTCNTHECVTAKLNAPDAEHIDGNTKHRCGRKQNPLTKYGSQLNPRSQVQLRIAGGTSAKHGDWPWQVSFQHRTCRKVNRNTKSCTWKHLCGASIVDNKWVITAAHCIVESGFFYDETNPGDDWSIVVGMDKLQNDQLGKTNKGTRFFLDKIVVHDTYKFNYITHADIALMKLSEPMEYNDYVQPICFPEGKQPQHGDMCSITGWGFTSGKGDTLSYNLKQAEIPIVDFQECRGVDVWYRLLDGNVHMCGGDRFKGGVDSCGGDSGGPLSCQRPDGTYYLAGVTSFGFSDCGNKGHVGIYARMTTFEQWAKDTIAADEQKSDTSPYYEDFHNLDQYRSGSISKNKGVYYG